MTASKQVVLLVSSFDSYFSTMIELAKRLQASGGYSPVIHFHLRYPNLERDIASCKREAIPVDLSRELSERTRATPSRMSERVLRRLAAMLARAPGVSFIRQVIAGYAKSLDMRRRIRRRGAELMVLGGDIVGHDMSLFIRAAREEGVSSVLIPNWMASPREAAESIFDHPAHQLHGPRAKAFARMFPDWAIEHRGRKLIRAPWAQVLALKTLRVAPPLPWVLHSGYANAIAVESQAAMDYGVREGLDPARIHVVGSTVHDVMSAERKRIANRTKQPSVLIALPQNMLYGHGRPGCDFSSYDELVDFWLNTVTRAAKHGEVVLSLHPSAHLQAVEHLIPTNVSVSSLPVQRLIPHCDCYVAAVSATIQWAIACAKPVINYDVYRYRYTDYESVAGVIRVEERKDFEALCDRMFNDRGYREEVRCAQEREAETWGVLDGQAFQRTLHLFNQLIQREVHEAI